MKKSFFVLFFIFLPVLCIGKDYIFIDYSPDIPPVKKFITNFAKYLNSIDKDHEFKPIRKYNIFKNPSEILDGLQANIIQLAIIPAYVVNNRFNDILSLLYAIDKKIDPDDVMIPIREQLMNYGIFLLDIFYGGNYNIFSKVRLRNTKNIVLGTLFSSKRIKNFFKNYSAVITIDSLNEVPQFIKKNIINGVLLSATQFYLMENVKTLSLPYRKRLKNLNFYFLIVANNSFWDGLSFNVKSILWSYITNNHNDFNIDFSRYKIFIENKISQYENTGN